MAYTTQAKIENLYGITLTSAQSAIIADVIAAVQAYIDGYVGKTFESVRETRYYNGNGRCELDIDSFTTSGMGVEILNPNGTTYRTLTRGQANDYIVGPYNQTEKYRLEVTRNGALGSFNKGRHNIRVSAKFGASDSVPADISMAATKLAYGFLKTDVPEGTQLTSIRLGDYAASYGAIQEVAKTMGVNTILESYRDIEI